MKLHIVHAIDNVNVYLFMTMSSTNQYYPAFNLLTFHYLRGENYVC